jgi:5-methylcytosine-specific restriction endonuclease McrA
METPSLYLHHLIPVDQSPTGANETGWIFEVLRLDKSHCFFELSESFVNYVLKNVICGNCLDRIGDSAHLTLCEKLRKPESNLRDRYHRFCYVPAAYTTEFKRLWVREKRRFRSFVRTSKLSKIPLPPEGIRFQLKDKQENRCYYCFNEFEANSSNLKPHLDHFVSVANGGTNSIFNLVYACGRCNREKFSENGEQFMKTSSIPAIERLVMIEGLLKDHYRTMPELNSPEHGTWAYESLKLFHRKQRIERESKKMPIGLFPSDISRNISKMRKSVGEWKEQFKPEYLSHVERLRKEHYRKMPHTRTTEFHKWLAEDYELQLRWECIRGEIP